VFNGTHVDIQPMLVLASRGFSAAIARSASVYVLVCFGAYLHTILEVRIFIRFEDIDGSSIG